jgi:hypothetical protein
MTASASRPSQPGHPMACPSWCEVTEDHRYIHAAEVRLITIGGAERGMVCVEQHIDANGHHVGMAVRIELPWDCVLSASESNDFAYAVLRANARLIELAGPAGATIAGPRKGAVAA